MTSPFKFKYPLPPQAQAQPLTPSTQLSARNFLLSHRPSSTPVSSLPPESPRAGDDIDDPYAHDIPRKRQRVSSFHDISSDDDELADVAPSSIMDTPVTKRPPVILPQPSPQSPTIDFSPSRRQPFQPNGLAAYTGNIIHEHNALSSVALPHLDQEDHVIVNDSKMAEGGVGYICRVETREGTTYSVLLLTPKTLAPSRNVNDGDMISISNAVKLDTIWICASWHH